MELNSEIKDYWEGEAKVYSRGIQEELDGPYCEAWKALIRDYVPHSGSLKILDAGCGPGFFPIILGEEGHEVTGIDITENMISCAEERVKARYIFSHNRPLFFCAHHKGRCQFIEFLSFFIPDFIDDIRLCKYFCKSQ